MQQMVTTCAALGHPWLQQKKFGTASFDNLSITKGLADKYCSFRRTFDALLRWQTKAPSVARASNKIHMKYRGNQYILLVTGGVIMQEPTMILSVKEDNEKEMKQILVAVYDVLREKGYNPVNQIVGYIISEDPTYITSYNNARSLIRKIDRDELLHVIVESYLKDWRRVF